MEFLNFSKSNMEETWPTSSTVKAVEDKNRFGHFWLLLGQKWPTFATKTAFLAHFEIIEGISLFFQYPIWMKLFILHQRIRLTKMKIVSDTSDSFKDQKWLIFAPKAAFLANFELTDVISLFFQCPIWMKLSILHQLLRLTKIKTVSGTSDSFWGQKWPIFVQKPWSLAYFWIIETLLHLLYVQNGWNMAYYIKGETQMKHRWNTGETLVKYWWMKHWWNTSKIVVKHWWNSGETLVEHRWNTGGTPVEHRLNTG